MACIVAMAVLPLLLGLSGGSPSNMGYRFDRESAPYVETVLGWMARHSLGKALEAGSTPLGGRADVEKYFQLAGRSVRVSRASWDPAPSGPARTAALSAELSPLRSELEALRPRVERLMQDRVAEALVENGFGRRVGDLDLLFPPVLFRFESLPYLLVVSPRDRIERSTTVLLRPLLTLEEAEELENRVWASGYSGLVVPIGGLGVYPSMVPEGADYRWTLRTVAHEWAHQFLATRPLGWRYAFGAERDHRMVTVNETVAEIVGREIGDWVYERGYPKPPAEQRRASPGTAGFDSRKALRDVRKRVDELLALGKVDEAESFMEASRESFARQGFHLRKLNQAYFAFHGTYADAPVSIGGAQGDDIAGRLRALRGCARSAGDFAWQVSRIGSYADFRRLSPEP